MLPIRIFSLNHYKTELKKADKVIGKIDKKDVDILALSSRENCLVWSEDKDFRNINEINLIRTKDLI